MTSQVTRTLRLLAAAIVGSLALTGCDLDVYDLPLPGGTDTGDRPLTVKAEFADVLDLVPQSTVKVNEVSVGKVTDVDLRGATAVVTLQLRRDVQLPANAVASIRQTSLLGEKFVSLAAPDAGASSEPLRDGATIPLERSGRNPEVEEVLGALSLVLNGGGVAQLKTISSELGKALDGNEDSARSVLTQIETLMGNLDDNKAAIVDAIESIDRLAKSARSQERTIDAALAELPSALTSIDAQRADLVRTLRALSRLGDVGVRVIKASKSQTIGVIRNLEPTLTQLAKAGDDLVTALDTAPTYPFTDDVVGRDPQVARRLHMGDYVNLSVDLDLDLRGILGSLSNGSVAPTVVNPTQTVSDLIKCIGSGSLTSPACKRVLASVNGLANLRNECQKAGNRDTTLCQLLNTVPGLPSSDGGTGSGGAGSGGLLGGLVGGLGRAAPGSLTIPSPPGGFTREQLAAIYDPSLAQLMLPGLDTTPDGPVPAGAGREGAR